MSWNISPVAFELFGLSIRWYGLLFATAFLAAYQCFAYLSRRDGLTKSDLRAILLCMGISTFVGGRVGHCVFYHWRELVANPTLLFDFRSGGNSSHGVVVAAICCMSCFALWKGWSILWLFDRLCVPIPLVAAAVRIGNFMNSEIVGTPTESCLGVVFVRHDSVLRHPVVLYEAAAYLALLVIMLGVSRTTLREVNGFLFGLFLTGLFTARFFCEYLKDSTQVSDQLPITMGQFLSIPCILLGIVLLLRSRRNGVSKCSSYSKVVPTNSAT